MASFIGLKLYAKSQPYLTHISLQMDNMTACHYINHLGRTGSVNLCMLALKMWNWCRQRNIHISPVYIPGQLNFIADILCRLINLNSEWKLNPAIFRQICVIYTTPDLDLFATRANNQVQKFISWFPDPDALATNAFSIPWSNQLCYAFPPCSQIMKCLKKIQSNKAKVLLIAPVWRSRLWFPILLSMLYESPIVASQYFRSIDSSITSRENAPETSHISHVAAVRRCLGQFKLSQKVSNIIMSSWRSGTQAQCKSAWSKWSSWCAEKQEDPVSRDISCFVEFLSELFDSGLQYRTINVYQSAISASHLSIEGSSIGSHQLVSRFMTGIYELHPPQPRVFTTWDVGTILRYLTKFHPAGTLSLKMLTLKLVMLSALVSASRCSYLYQFDLKYHYIKDENYFFVVAVLVKGSTPKKPHMEIRLPSFPEDPALYSFSYCQEYIRRTQTYRPDSSSKDLLFLSYIKPHNPVKICTIARWVKEVLSLSGIDISQFSAHSTRSASTSSAFKSGVPISDIMKVADWTQASTFKKFYQKPIKDCYGIKILSSANTVEIHNYGNEEDAL